MRGQALQTALNNLRTGPGLNQIVNNIQKEIDIARARAARGGLSFREPLQAVYHYRKHGREFPVEINNFGKSIKTYLGPVKNKVFDAHNAKEVSHMPVSFLCLDNMP